MDSVGVEEKAKLYLGQLWEETYELKYKGQEGGMALGVSVTCHMFDFGYVALELPMRQPQQVQGVTR